MEEINVKKLFSKRNIIIFIILAVAILVMLMGGAFLKFKRNLNELANTQADYEKSIKITNDGISKNTKTTQNKIMQKLNVQTATLSQEQNRYNRIASMEGNSLQKLSDQNYDLVNQILLSQLELDTTESLLVAVASEEGEEPKSKAEEFASKIKELGDYIKDSPTQTKEQKLAYLMNAAIVTKYPYIESIAGDKTKLNGTIKFYRYLESIDDAESETQEILLTFIELSAFNAKLEEYKASGNEDVFKYFTIDDDENVVIAYGAKTKKTVETNDNDVTVNTINEVSTESYSKTGTGKYTSETYTVNTKLIDYKSLAEPYMLPFNLLATLLVQTKNYPLVKDIADLAYDSEIVIGIYDNKSVTTSGDTYTYNKKIKYTENTELIFENISTDPQVDISSSRYSEVVKECFGKLDENRENAIHCSGIDLEDLETATGNRTDGNVYEAYIKEISSAGIVTDITDDAGEAKTFETELCVEKIQNSTPTVGIILADIWAGKWTATYVKEENNFSVPATENGLEDEYLNKVANDKFASALLEESGLIGGNLKNHSTQLKAEAIAKIIEKTDFTVEPRTKNTLDIRKHGNTCEECKNALDANYPNWKSKPKEDEEAPKPIESPEALNAEGAKETRAVDGGNLEDPNLVNAVNTQESLAIVKQHVEEILKNEAETKTSDKRTKFETDINKPGQITYNQWPTVYEANVSIKQISTYNKDATTYKKDSSNAEEQGEKFSSILSKVEYRKTKDAIVTRETWFWDSIREYEDTAKLENLLRYIFNISFNTTAFGTYSATDIDEIFKIFEPQNTNLVSIKVISPFGTIHTKEEFVKAVQSYNGGENYSKLLNLAETFYDICTSETYNVNPCLAYAWACFETEYGNVIENNNLFSKTLNQGRIYATYADSIKDFCAWILKNENILEDDVIYERHEVEIKITIAKTIFGNVIFFGGEGAYETVNDVDYFGIYTSSAGRKYIEWKQAKNTTYGGLVLHAWDGTMAQYGCGLYSASMLLNSVGVNTTPGDFYYKYNNNYSFINSIKSILDENNIDAMAKSIYSVENYVKALSEGNGIMTYVAPGSGYTSKQHWIVTSDIRLTQTGSIYGYDVYVLSSTHVRGATYGWVPIETVVDNLYEEGHYGIYISNN